MTPPVTDAQWVRFGILLGGLLLLGGASGWMASWQLEQRVWRRGRRFWAEDEARRLRAPVGPPGGDSAERFLDETKAFLDDVREDVKRDSAGAVGAARVADVSAAADRPGVRGGAAGPDGGRGA